MNTNLVYCCVFHNPNYGELLRVLMLTVKLYSRTDGIDFLVLTTRDFEAAIQRISTILDIPIRIQFCDDAITNNAEQATYFRYRIFDYENINQYKKILYLDTDIIVQNDLTPLFELDIEDRVHAMSEGTIEHSWHGGTFFDFTTIDKDTKGMNSGILFFRNTDTVKQIFQDVRNHIQQLKDAGEHIPGPGDQPVFNYNCIKRGAQDTVLMDKYGCIYCVDPPPPPMSPTDVILCHFVYPIGDALHKRDRMAKHVTHLFNHYNTLLKYPQSFVEPDILGNAYTWGEGSIRFINSSVIKTIWGDGEYKWLDQYTLEANWSGFSHIVRFNSSYTNYVSVRKGDLDYGKGILIDDPLTKYLNSRGFYDFEGYSQEIQAQVNDMIHLTMKPNITMMEIGFNAGHSANVFLKHNSSLLLTSFDLGDHKYGPAAKEYINTQYPNRHMLILGDSKQTVADYIVRNPGKTFDIIFIDGGHDYETARADLENCRKLAHMNTIVIMDDTVFYWDWYGPTKAWNEFVDTNKVVELGRRDYSIRGRGMAWGRYII